MKIAFAGAGNLASALIGGLLKSGLGRVDIVAIDPGEPTREQCRKTHGVQVFSALHEVRADDFDAIVLAVKPQVLKSVAAELTGKLSSSLIISVAAGIRLEDLSRWLGGYRKIVRAMPNTPAQVGLGIAGLYALPEVSAAQKEIANRILASVGTTVWLEEEAQLDAVTAISGSGPAYVFYFIEALHAAGLKLGLPDQQARALALATFSGAAGLANVAGEPPHVLRERVTSKGGTTAAALSSFEQDDIKRRIIDGVMAAQRRAVELGNELGDELGSL